MSRNAESRPLPELNTVAIVLYGLNIADDGKNRDRSVVVEIGRVVAAEALLVCFMNSPSGDVMSTILKISRMCHFISETNALVAGKSQRSRGTML